MTSRKWKIAHWIYLIILVCLLLFCTLINFFICSTIQTSFTLQSWAEVSDPHSIKCLDQKAIGFATRALHIITDWFLLPVPLIIIWRLQMPLSRKIRLMVVFSIGVVSSVASIVRNVLTERIGSDITSESSQTRNCKHRSLTTSCDSRLLRGLRLGHCRYILRYNCSITASSERSRRPSSQWLETVVCDVEQLRLGQNPL